MPPCRRADAEAPFRGAGRCWRPLARVVLAMRSRSRLSAAGGRARDFFTSICHCRSAELARSIRMRASLKCSSFCIPRPSQVAGDQQAAVSIDVESLMGIPALGSGRCLMLVGRNPAVMRQDEGLDLNLLVASHKSFCGLRVRKVDILQKGVPRLDFPAVHVDLDRASPLQEAVEYHRKGGAITASARSRKCFWANLVVVTCASDESVELITEQDRFRCFVVRARSWSSASQEVHLFEHAPLTCSSARDVVEIPATQCRHRRFGLAENCQATTLRDRCRLHAETEPAKIIRTPGSQAG